ncbi:hypothetical protein [Novosphingobium rosa]|uniref:hypothetical protein n=1 Tax=Novosphingobium rosa TaxID=76978 RepID=UPI0008307AF0|nr:hypothetical protein [Novosphingobium rosa]
MHSICTLGLALTLSSGATLAYAAPTGSKDLDQDLEPRYEQAQYSTVAAHREGDGRWGEETGRKLALDLCSQAVSQQTSGAGFARLGPVTQEIWKHWGFRIAGVFYIQSRAAQNADQPGPLRRGSYVCDTRDGQIQRLKLHGY